MVYTVFPQLPRMFWARSWSGRLKAMSGNSNNHGYEFVSLPCSIRRASLKLVKACVFSPNPCPRFHGQGGPQLLPAVSPRPASSLTHTRLNYAAFRCCHQPFLTDGTRKHFPQEVGLLGLHFLVQWKREGLFQAFPPFPSRFSGWKGLSYLSLNHE